MPTKYRDSDPLLGGVLYAGGSYSEGGSYMLVDTVLKALDTVTENWALKDLDEPVDNTRGEILRLGC
jgi:hypothetical protein